MDNIYIVALVFALVGCVLSATVVALYFLNKAVNQDAR